MVVEKIVAVAEETITETAEKATTAATMGIIAAVPTILINMEGDAVMNVITRAILDTRATINAHIIGGRDISLGTETGRRITRRTRAQEALARDVDEKMIHGSCFEDIRR